MTSFPPHRTLILLPQITGTVLASSPIPVHPHCFFAKGGTRSHRLNRPEVIPVIWVRSLQGHEGQTCGGLTGQWFAMCRWTTERRGQIAEKRRKWRSRDKKVHVNPKTGMVKKKPSITWLIVKHMLQKSTRAIAGYCGAHELLTIYNRVIPAAMETTTAYQTNNYLGLHTKCFCSVHCVY